MNFNNKKYIIFDLDGTLIDSIGIWNEADKKLIYNHTKLDIDENIIMEDRNNFLENNQDTDIYIAYCQYLIDKYNFDIKDSENISNERKELANLILSTETDFKPGVVELINLLKQMGYIIILATITTKEQLSVYYSVNRKMISQMNIKETFDSIFTKEDAKKKKPNPEIYLKVLKNYNAKPDECIVFEDSWHGILAANGAGIETINIYDKYSDSDREKINKLANYKINSYYEVIDILKQQQKVKQLIPNNYKSTLN